MQNGEAFLLSTSDIFESSFGALWEVLSRALTNLTWKFKSLLLYKFKNAWSLYYNMQERLGKVLAITLTIGDWEQLRVGKET